MACNPDFVQFIIDQCSDAGEIAVKKMMGDWCAYCDHPTTVRRTISTSAMWMTGIIWQVSSRQRFRHFLLCPVLRRNQLPSLFPISAIRVMARITTASPNSQIAPLLSILCSGSNDNMPRPIPTELRKSASQIPKRPIFL